MKALGGAFVILAACLLAAGYAFWPAPPAQTSLAIGGDFRLLHESGVELDTAEVFKDQPMLVYFGYTYCPDVCPTTLMDMVSASEETEVDEALVFVTIDPARDKADSLLAYTDLFTPALQGFTGAAASIEAVKADWAIYAARHDTEEFSDYLMDHTTLTFLTDRDHRVIEVFRGGTPPQVMATAINALF